MAELGDFVPKCRSLRRVLALTTVLLFVQACAGIDTTREAPKATLGDDMYAVLCDRLGAGVLSEDLLGASYHSICHLDANGQYGFEIDLRVLPQVAGEKATTARALSVAKMQAMAQHRSLLVRAFNAAFPDTTIPDVTTADPSDEVRLHQALLSYSQQLTKLYLANPYEPARGGLMPTTSDGLGALFEKLEESEAARLALTRMAGRQGYRPSKVAMGAIRTMLSYPELRTLVSAALGVVGPGGTATAEVQQLLTVAKRELQSSSCELCQEPPLVIDEASATLNRPRYAIEVLARLMLEESDAYQLPGDVPRFITRRDHRGVAVPYGNTPGETGTVPAPFSDGNGDGLADIDSLGRFVDDGGVALAIDSPFAVPGEPISAADEFGRSTANLYQYVDTSQTLLAHLARDLVPLVDPTTYAGGSPEGWLIEHETLMYALAGMHVLAGERTAAQFDHEHDTILAANAPCTAASVPCTSYQRFDADKSPLPDLVHGLGQLIADPDSDAIFIALETLIRDHEDVVARLMAAALKINDIGLEHDQAAAKGEVPPAELAYSTPIWDEIAQIVSDMTTHPNLVRKLVLALADDTIVTEAPQDAKIKEPAAQHLGETLSAFMTMRDRFNYNPDDINGPALNVTDGNGSISNPHNPVDYTAPQNGENRSMFEVSGQLIFDATRVKACNKPGAKLHTTITDWPLFGSYDECELFVFPNMGGFYLDALLPATHPKRGFLQVAASGLQALMKFVGVFTSPDKLLEASAGITGLTQHPSPNALNRLLFFGAMSDRYGQLPDYDHKNAGSDTAEFVGMAIDPVCSPLCPKNQNGVNVCDKSKAADVLRLRDRGVIFGWERLGFQGYLRPQLEAFAEVGCNTSVTACSQSDYTGENYFLDLMSTLWKHWPDMNHGDYCDHTVAKEHPRYCSGAGANHYEPILGAAFLTDIIPALHEFSKVAASVDITVARGPNKGKKVNGAQIVETLVKILFSQDYASERGVTDRFGNKATKWVDGTPQAQVTVFSIFADALHQMDERFEHSSLADAAVRKSKWRRARSQLTDQFLQVEGSGKNARFVNRAVPEALLAALRVMREQVNAHCPNRESDQQCDWARFELGNKLADTLSRPTFAAIADVTDKLNQDEAARRELERFVSFALSSQSDSDALHGMMASIGDSLQLFGVDGDLSPIFNAAAVALSPADDVDGPGAADRGVQLLHAMNGPDYDHYQVLDYVLPALVLPLDGGQGSTPLEVILDAVADIHRYDPNVVSPLDSEDYRFVMKTVSEFFLSPYRGFQQLYYIVEHRSK